MIFTMWGNGYFVKAASVTPEHWDDNFPYMDQIKGIKSIKVDPPTSGTYYLDTAQTKRVVVTFSENGTKVAFKSDIPLSYVYVKGGEGGGGNIFKYDPTVTEDSDLYCNIKDNSGQYQQISHVTFYYYDTAIKVVKYLEKVGGENQSGVTFNLIRNEKLVASDITDENGVIEFKYLIPGDYYLEEVVPEGYKTDLDSSKKIVLTAENSPVLVNVVNTQTIVGSIRIEKTLANTENAPQPGVTFILMQNSKEVATGITDENGVVEFKNLPLGSYTLKEIVPTGYTTDLNENAVIVLTEAAPNQTVKVVNTKIPVLGSIRVEKTIGSTENTPQPGVTFILMQGNKEVATGITDENGVVEFKNLPLGSYTLKEIVPTGYTTDLNENAVIVLTEAAPNQTVKVVNTKIPVLGSIRVEKTIGSTENTPQPGVTFILMQGNKEVATGITDENGVVEFKELPLGSYTLKEIVPTGYTTDLNENAVIVLTEAAPNKTVKVVNTKIPVLGSITIYKTIGDGIPRLNYEAPVPQQGITFILLQDGVEVTRGVTDSNGKVVFKDLKLGKYNLKEVVPSGYKSNLDENQIIELTEETPDISYYVVNTKLNVKGSIKIIKTIDNENGTPQKGVTFKLKLNGEVIATGVTNEYGIVEFLDLEEGQYVIEEVVPDKYTTSLNENNSKINLAAGENKVVKVVNTKIEDHDLPYTGGFMEIEIAVGILAIFMMAAGIIIRRRLN